MVFGLLIDPFLSLKMIPPIIFRLFVRNMFFTTNMNDRKFADSFFL